LSLLISQLISAAINGTVKIGQVLVMFGSASKTNMPESSMAKIIKTKPDIKEITIAIMFFDIN